MRFVSLILFPIALIGIFFISNKIDPQHSLEYTIYAFLSGAAIWFGKNFFASKAEQGKLQAQVDSIKTSNSKLENELSDSQKENIRLKEEIVKYNHRESLLNKYEFIPKYGIYKHRTKDEYVCHKCLLKDSLISPLSEQNGYWNCSICKNTYHNPDYHYPEQNQVM